MTGDTSRPENDDLDNPIDYGALTQELVRKVRGDRSQGLIRRKLKFESNRISKWENGHAVPSWDGFLQLCEACDRDAMLAIRSCLGFSGRETLIECLKDLVGHDSVRKAADHFGVSDTKLRRWLKGETIPSLPDLLSLIERRHLLARFVSRLFPEQKIDLTRHLQSSHDRCRDLVYDYPETTGVLCYLSLKSYVNECHSDELIARNTGIPINRLRVIIDRLLDTGVIEKEGNLYVPTDIVINSGATNASEFTRNQLVKSYWIEKSMSLVKKDSFEDRGTYATYQIFCIKKSTAVRIREELDVCFGKVFDLLESECTHGEGEVVQVMNVQITDAFDPENGKSG